MFQSLKVNLQKVKEYIILILQSLKHDYHEIREKSKDLTKTNFELGQFHLKHGHIPDAILRFRITLFLNSSHAEAHYELARCYVLKESTDKAMVHLRKAIELTGSYPEAEFLLAKLDPNLPTPTSIPLSLIERHFNEIAHEYTTHFLQELHYKGHFFIRDKLISLPVDQKNTLLTILDLGCGPGFCGSIAREIFPNSVVSGVDIAENMLTEARKTVLHNDIPVYYQLIHTEAHDYLRQNKSMFQIILAGYILHYIGDLAPLFQLVSKALDPQGTFIFTIEKSSQAPFTLLPNFERFAHHPSYIEQIAAEHHFSISVAEPAKLHDECEGYIYVLQKQAARE